MAHKILTGLFIAICTLLLFLASAALGAQRPAGYGSGRATHHQEHMSARPGGQRRGFHTPRPHLKVPRLRQPKPHAVPVRARRRQ